MDGLSLGADLGKAGHPPRPDAAAGDAEIVLLLLDADEPPALHDTGDARGARAHERIEDGASGRTPPHQLSHHRGGLPGLVVLVTLPNGHADAAGERPAAGSLAAGAVG